DNPARGAREAALRSRPGVARQLWSLESLDKIIDLRPSSRPRNRPGTPYYRLIPIGEGLDVNSNTCGIMRFFSSRSLGVLFGVAGLVLIGAQAGFAQSGGNNAQAKPPDGKQAAADAAAAKETQKKINEIAEARRLVSGAAGNPECV